MGFLVLALFIVGTAGGLVFHQSWQREQAARLRDRARIKVIEGQMIMLRTALRISATEHGARRRMHAASDDNVFTNSTVHEEPEEWRS